MNIVLSFTPGPLFVQVQCSTVFDPSFAQVWPHLHKLYNKWILYWLSPLICTSEYCTQSSIPSLYKHALTNARVPLWLCNILIFLDPSLLNLKIFILCKCFVQYFKLPTWLACSCVNFLYDGWYVGINAYKFTVIWVWRDVLYYHILRVHAILTYRFYRLYDNFILCYS